MRKINDYDDVIQPPKAASEAGKFVCDVSVNCTPVPPLCPTGRVCSLSPLVKESTV